ncbi:type VI-A CRISPR-associated RNA-guided ribonuclease Cas13a [Rhodovulum tesquicola]|uniref:CRISPR-associated endoribonuclease Cas13a n=1 Tax=Rhodovulum steppense TaxID=540251 RepID=A0A4R1YWY2_9RHOB|nr:MULTISPECIES: type VI-A CRISPR-associated RNA-guided ribonuclease Cas13a [Rhodovulum]MCO8145878.1 type VI-A CRISPR-associated RNA-guided ribonuclease Cas13a [Rhodovulum tesquicola]TCM85486.1 hypothetical protein EV216_10760 [Rhodovulum steppense]
MRIVRPYGESRTDLGGERGQTRVLVDNTAARARHEIPDFAQSHDALVIAQWISVLDRIATKPQGTQGATRAQHAFRDRLGRAAWAQMCAADRISAAAQADPYVAALWRFKTHPYGDAKYRPRKGKDGKPLGEPKPQGRWYGRFAANAEPEQADVAAIAALMDHHLHVAELRIDPKRPEKRKGLIEARAKSIEGNVLVAEPRKRPVGSWSREAITRYFMRQDVAAEIFAAARDREQGLNDVPRGPVRLALAAKILHGHWTRLFHAPGTRTAYSIREAEEKEPELFALHMAVKDAYAKLLKRRTQPKTLKKGVKPPQQAPVTTVLPKNAGELLRLVQHRSRNRDLSALIRRGKLIHYTAFDIAAAAAEAESKTPDVPDADRLAYVLTHWPDDLSASRYLTSDGQSAIKRSEAFVRVWRHTIAMASLTLRDWASMNNDLGDVLGSANKVDQAIGRANFDPAWHDKKVRLLFGARAALFPSDDDGRKALLASVIRAGLALRNSSFHFTGRGGFLAALKKLGSEEVMVPSILAAAHALWREDATARAGRLRAALTGAHAAHYFEEDQNASILTLLDEAPPKESLPIPRFRRVLGRAENTWKGKEALVLPPTANRRQLEDPARRCRYTILKALYERPFRSWLIARAPEEVNAWIDRAIERTTRAAKDMNAKRGEDDKRSVIAAKAESLPRLSGERGIGDFFFDLSSATASEMRVQRGYGHDGEAAKEQAGYIDDLLCDVVALAFDAWLRNPQANGRPLTFICDLKPETPLPAAPKCTLQEIGSAAEPVRPEDWQAALYLLLHLVPVGEAGRLLHQLAKWTVTSRLADDLLNANVTDDPSKAERTADEEDLKRLVHTLIQHLDMHDAKFEGGDALTGCEPFAALFASRPGFARIFPAEADERLDRRVPKRGLREIMRFGHHGLVASFAEDTRITDKEVGDYLRLEIEERPDNVAALQARKEEAHERWVKAKEKRKTVDPKHLEDYVTALCGIARHRRLASRVTLTDQVQVHRLLMTVLGRLVDFSGMFERDLYFAMLGLLDEKGARPDEVFSGPIDEPKSRLALLANGRVLAALREQIPHSKDLAEELRKDLERLFGMDCSGIRLLEADERGDTCLRDIRNDLSHFNLLHDDSFALDLTTLVNRTRGLMSYDRKLKNAVSKSIKELLAREGLTLSWDMTDRHDLENARIGAKPAVHLGGRKLAFRGGDRRPEPVRENLHSPTHLEAVARLFGGKVVEEDDVTNLDLSSIDWAAEPHNSKETHRHRPAGPRKSPPKRRAYHAPR